MPEAADNRVLRTLPAIRGTLDEHSARFDAIDASLESVKLEVKDVKLSVATLDMRFDALDERVAMIREGAVTAIGNAANASRAHVALRKQIADLARGVEKLEAGG